MIGYHVTTEGRNSSSNTIDPTTDGPEHGMIRQRKTGQDIGKITDPSTTTKHERTCV